MKISPKLNPMHCASKDGTRYILNGVKISGNLVTSTDGRTLFAAVCHRDEDDDTRDALIPTRAAKAAWPQSKRKGKGVSDLPLLTINPIEDGLATVTITDSKFDKTTIKEINGRFPSIHKVVPDVSGHTFKIGLNANYLLQIAKCFGQAEVVLHVNPSTMEGGSVSDPMLVTNPDSPDALAILMPMRCHECKSDLHKNPVIQEMVARNEADKANQEAENAKHAEELARKEAEKKAKAVAEARRVIEEYEATQTSTTSAQ